MKLCIEIELDSLKDIGNRDGEFSKMLAAIPDQLPRVIRETGNTSIHDSAGQWVGNFWLKLGHIKR